MLYPPRLRAITVSSTFVKVRGELQRVVRSEDGDQNVTNPAGPVAASNRRQRRSRR
jgi:hypothetical protein